MTSQAHDLIKFVQQIPGFRLPPQAVGLGHDQVAKGPRAGDAPGGHRVGPLGRVVVDLGFPPQPVAPDPLRHQHSDDDQDDGAHGHRDHLVDVVAVGPADAQRCVLAHEVGRGFASSGGAAGGPDRLEGHPGPARVEAGVVDGDARQDQLGGAGNVLGRRGEVLEGELGVDLAERNLDVEHPILAGQVAAAIFRSLAGSFFARIYMIYYKIY